MRLLFLGQARARAGDLPGAERPYGEAFAVVPFAQSATVAWAGSLPRLGRDADALGVTQQWLDRELPTADPWLEYVASEWRFLEAWLGRLRRLVRP